MQAESSTAQVEGEFGVRRHVCFFEIGDMSPHSKFRHATTLLVLWQQEAAGLVWRATKKIAFGVN
jgi:hypothetical protein